MTTILELIEDVADELDLERPTQTTLFASYDEGDVTNKRLLRSLSRTCTYLARKLDWQILKREHTFVTVSGEAQTAWKPTAPSSFLRFVPNSVQDRSRRLPVVGPLTSEEWQAYKSQRLVHSNPAFYIRGDVAYLADYPDDGATIAFEYITKNIGRATGGGAEKERFTSYDDEALFTDDELLRLGIAYHYRKMAKLDSAQEEVDFETAIQDSIKQDGGARKFNMGRGSETATELVQSIKSQAIVVGVTS